MPNFDIDIFDRDAERGHRNDERAAQIVRDNPCEICGCADLDKMTDIHIYEITLDDGMRNYPGIEVNAICECGENYKEEGIL